MRAKSGSLADAEASEQGVEHVLGGGATDQAVEGKARAAQFLGHQQRIGKTLRRLKRLRGLAEPAERVRALARAKGCTAEDITVCILERPRHEEMIEEVRSTGAAIRLITDGDVAGVIHCAEAEITGIDMYMGSGGAPEGVLAAAALKCMGGQFYGKLLFRNDDEKARARKAGITNFDRVYTRDDLVRGDVIFAATGVTQGSILRGIERAPGHITTETILMRSKTGSIRRMSYRSPMR